MKSNALLLALCLVACSCGGGTTSQRASAQILVIGGADTDEPAGPLGVVGDDGIGFHWLSTPIALEARWSPDGRRIAFIAADNFSAESSIFVMNADGSDQLEIVPTWHGYNHLLEWSPDGRRILYARPSNLWSTRADGSEKRRLARSVGEVGWSPDAKSIAFTHKGAVYVMRDDGSGVTRLASHAFSPHWTPDSKTIVFLRGTEGEAGGVYTVAAGGGKPRRLARILADYIADVAPDGHSVLLGTGAGGLAVVSIDDGMVRQLTRQLDDYGGDWSPDGRRIAFIHGSDLWIVNTDGSKATRVFKAPPAPDGSPDGVFFSLALWKP